jgi:hypothetical protein
MPCASSRGCGGVSPALDAKSNEGCARYGIESGGTPPYPLQAPLGFGAARPHLRRCRSSAIPPYRLRRGALQLEPRRPERLVSYFGDGTLGSIRIGGGCAAGYLDHG